MLARSSPRLPTLIVLLHAAVAPAASAETPTTPRIIVLASQDTAPYREIVEGFQSVLREQHTSASIVLRFLDGRPEAANEEVRDYAAGNVTLFIPLGTNAVRAMVEQKVGTPIVASMILRESEIEAAVDATAVVLEFPTEVELHWLRQILPRSRRVGVLYNAAENQARIDRATRLAQDAGLELRPHRVDAPKDLPGVLETLGAEVQVLWGVTDQIVMTPETAKPLMLFSIRERIPFVGLSSAWVKAGALYALDRDYHDIGRQVAEVALRVLAGQSAKSLTPARPRKVVYSLNQRTAKAIGISLPAAVLRDAKDVIE
ncbi:MAG: ABC transporter substrate binding protein [Acidobacteriota bacterium]